MLQHLIIYYSLHYLSSGRLREGKNIVIFHLQEVVAYKRFQI